MVVRSTSTRNIKPGSVSAYSWKPASVNTTNYASTVNITESSIYGTFKYAAKKYGTGTRYSAGQKMAVTSTVEI